MPFLRSLSNAGFNFVHQRNLVYNTCWEDPRLDRIALDIQPDDNVLMITSAGCNALDYALTSPNHIYAVDVNPRQNALLELKIAAIRQLEFSDFFEMFGKGRIKQHNKLYRSALRSHLSEPSRAIWDKHIDYFQQGNDGQSFFYRGSSGFFARMLNIHIDKFAKVREGINGIMNADDVKEQERIYNQQVKHSFWNMFLRWAVSRDSVLSLVGVPNSQRKQIEKHYGSMADFVEDCIEYVFARLPFTDNYFWRVYLCGEYTNSCCPEYLKEENFAALKKGLVDSISIHTTTIEQFLKNNDVNISKYVLLDHMDWLGSFSLNLLQQEWQAMLNRAADKARFIWRSGALEVDFIDPLHVNYYGSQSRLGSLLSYNTTLATDLHKRDRVGTYGSFYIADLV